MGIGYITLGANDVEQALPFFDAVLGAIGYERGPLDGGWAFYGAKGQPSIGICRPHDGADARGGNGIMIALKAADHDQVALAYRAALAAGAPTRARPATARRTGPASTAPISAIPSATSSASTPRRTSRPVFPRYGGSGPTTGGRGSMGEVCG